MEYLFVRPMPNLKIRNPDTGLHLKPDGERVQKRSYWLRRKKEGSVSFEAPQKKTDVKFSNTRGRSRGGKQ